MGGFIAATFGLEYPMRFTSVPLVLAIFVALFFKEPSTNKSNETKRYLNILIQGFKNVTTHIALRRLVIETVLIFGFSYFVIWFYQPKLQRLGVAITLFGFFHLFLTLAEVLWLRFLPWLDDKLKRTDIIIVASSLLIGISFIATGIMNNILGVLLLLFFAGGLGLTRRQFVAHIIHRYIPSKERATTISFIGMARYFVLVILNPIMGFMADWSLNNALIFLGLATLGVVAISVVIDNLKKNHIITDKTTSLF